MHSTLKHSDPATRTLTVHPSQSFPEVRKTLQVAADAVIKLNGKPVKLEALEPEDWLETVGEPATWVAARRFGETKETD